MSLGKCTVLTREEQIVANKPRFTLEQVDHPAHYQSGQMEVIEVIEAFDLSFNLGNVTKYVLRAGKKTNRQEDLKKALWYLNRELKKDE